MAAIRGTPYIRGCAQGRLHRGLAGMEHGCLCLLTQDELTTLCSSPDRQASFDALSTLAGGLIIIDGARFSHAMIRLLVLGIPTVIVSGRQASQLGPASELEIDGASGIISDESVAGDLTPPSPTLPAPSVPLFTKDRQVIELRASIADRAGAERALSHGASGIGLVRTENLVLSSHRLPGVDDFEVAFRRRSCGRNTDVGTEYRRVDKRGGSCRHRL